MSDGGAGLPIIGLRLADGRTGSTLVMQLLGTAPEIAFDRKYPAEYRWASYFGRMAEQTTMPFDADEHLGVTPFFFGPQPAWGPVPFRSDVVDVESLRAPLLRARWASWSAEVRDRQPGVRYYAEKLAVPIDTLLDAGLDVRVVDLLRDPRDTLASIRAFTATGAGDGFGRQEVPLDEQGYLETFVERFGLQLRVMQATPDDVDRLVLRYEDLVADLDACADRLGSWLGVHLDVERVRAAQDDHRHHMTSPSPETSVGRWRQDLAPAEAERIAAALGSAMNVLGYDLFLP